MTAESADDLCWKIITAVAEERNIEREAIEERLGKVIDTGALHRLAEQSSESESIDFSMSFQYGNCFVTVTDGGCVRASCPGEPERPRLVKP